MRLRTLLAGALITAVTVVVPAAERPSAQEVPNVSSVRLWNAHALAALGPALSGGAGQPPNLAVLNMAMVQGAVFDAVNSIDGGHEPLNVDVTAVSPSASMDAAVAAAAFGVLDGLGRAPVPPLPALVRDTLRGHYNDSIERISDSPAPGADPTDHLADVAAGIAAGAAAADAMLRARDGDGRYVTFPLTEGDEPGEWRPVEPATLLDPFSWISEVDPFTLTSTSQFRTPGPRNLNSAAYAHEYNEVKSLGSKTNSGRTTEQTLVAQFYNVNPLELFNRTFRTIAGNEGLSLVEEARLFGTLNVAAADAIINCWDDKRFHSFWRPETAIRKGDDDGNKHTVGDIHWTSLETNPPYSDHSSGYNCMSGAFMHTGKAFFGGDQMTFSVMRSTAASDLVRNYQRFTGVVDDTIDARVYQGLHFRSADVQGARIGRQVAEWVNSNAF